MNHDWCCHCCPTHWDGHPQVGLNIVLCEHQSTFSVMAGIDRSMPLSDNTHPFIRSLNTCNNKLSGEAPTWMSSLRALTARLVTLSECSGTCTPGYWCVNSSLSVVANECPSGSYSTAGSAACTQCPLGTYATAPATRNQCTRCELGRYGDTVGQTAACSSQCPPGRFGGLLGANSSACTGPCDAGRWGTYGETTSQCSGPCDAG